MVCNHRLQKICDYANTDESVWLQKLVMRKSHFLAVRTFFVFLQSRWIAMECLLSLFSLFEKSSNPTELASVLKRYVILYRKLLDNRLMLTKVFKFSMASNWVFCDSKKMFFSRRLGSGLVCLAKSGINFAS